MQEKYVNSDIVAIIVTYNRKTILYDSLEALLHQSILCDIYIIDNASTDGTKDFIQKYLINENIKYFNTGLNLGGAGGFHYGLNKAAQAGYSYAWLMDDDTIASPKALEEIIESSHILNDKFGFLCSYVQWIDKTPCKMNIPCLSKKWIYFSENIKKGLIPLESASFVSYFIKISTVYEIGLPYKDFFIWADDVEYSLRISKIYPSFLVLNSIVTHKMSSNESTSIAIDESRIERYRMCYRNRYFLSKKHKKLLNFTKYLMLNILDILKNSPTHKVKKMITVLLGVWDGLFFNPSIDYPSQNIDNKR